LSNLLNNEWEQTRSPAGAIQWIPKGGALKDSVADAHVSGKFATPIMFTTDLALKMDPSYRKIAERFVADPNEYRLAFAKAWYKLTHRDMGPRANYLGDAYPTEETIWQDPISDAGFKPLRANDIRRLKKDILDSGLSVQELVRVAWGSAASYRDSDMRGGANGARIALAPQKDWAVNNPAEAAKVISKLKEVKKGFRRGVSLSDLIVLGGAAAIEKAAKDAGFDVEVPFVSGRGDATQAQTDVNSFSFLEPKVDGFRNFYTKGYYLSPTEALVNTADQLALTVPEMTVLVGGMRALGANTDGSNHGVLTDKPGTLTNDFFVNLLDMSTKWRKTGDGHLYEGVNRKSGKVVYTATPVDLVFGSSNELRAVAEVYAFDNSKERFVNDFVKAWSKVMQNDRFDLR
jgi:catalase-peroxidase